MEKSKDTVIAINEEQGKVFNTLDGLPKKSINDSWYCVNCKKPLFYDPVNNVFRHKCNLPCGFEPQHCEVSGIGRCEPATLFTSALGGIFTPGVARFGLNYAFNKMGELFKALGLKFL